VEAWSQDAVDVLRMFAALEVDRVEDAVSPETRRMMIRYGLTPAVHDRLVAEMNLRNANRGRHWGRRENCLIDYTEKEKCCAGQAGRYRFCLPRDTDELRYYGQHFHNCVASYADSALEKRSLIVAMKLEEYYIACIEVQRNTIVQALGPCNKELSAEHKEIIRQWASQTGLLYA